MKILVEIIKGIIIGVANIMPGLSGGTLAIAMGIYEKLIYAVNHIFKQPIKCIKMVWTYGIGIVLGIGGSVLGIVYLFNIAPVPVSMLFVGLIIGSLPTIREKLGTDKLTLKDYIVFTIMAAIIMFMPIISGERTAVISNSFKDLVIMFGIGLLTSATIVIPGISGSMILMSIGYYASIMTIASNTLKNCILLNFSAVFSNFGILLSLGLGVLIGIFLTAKIIEILFKKHYTAVHWGIIGLIVASPFPIILGLDLYNISLTQIFISIVLFIAGVYATKMLSSNDKGGEIDEKDF